MFAVRNLIRGNAQFAKNAVIPKRNMTVIATPAKNKVSTGEVIALSTVMIFGWCAIPAWVLYNMKNYRDKN